MSQHPGTDVMGTAEPPETQDTAPGETSADARVRVSVLHGGFDAAKYAVMVGVYADEEMSGSERFLDDQFAQLLSGWRDLGRYPGRLGTSVFVEPRVDVDQGCRPAGAHLVGLGSALELTRQQLAFAVRRTLVNRCVRLYPPVSTERDATAAAPARQRVGVSTALLGVRDDESLRVEDAVAGILEGVLESNRALARFERGRGMTTGVRVAAVEFVERFAHRANLTATAVRRIQSVPGMSDDFVELDNVIVRVAEGGLPQGAALIEKDRSWRRFVITEHRFPDATPESDPTRPLVVEVSALARGARADRVIHRIDRVSLDALAGRVSANRDDNDALRALRDRLVPHSMRADFLTTEGVQLVLDQATANFPWELLAAPRPSAAGSRGRARAAADEPTGTGSVLRLFTEPGGGRLQRERAGVGTALIIGAGNVQGLPPLPGAIDEAQAVYGLLRPTMRCKLLIDAEKPFDVADLNVKLLGDHQIVHLACHGIHVEGDRYATGAVLTNDLRFTVDLVESMPIVPELVFVNSCYNARIGLSPLAAGLARSLMGIGVRAVVAAGWPVGDEAAKAFATSFYGSMIHGVAFGDAVTRARAESASADHGATWAAYQCYGDPTFVLRGRQTEVAPTGAPVGLADLKTQLGALATQVADLSRPRPGALQDRRDRLLSRYRALERWVTDQGNDFSNDPDVWRLLALAARELCEWYAAATWYKRFANDDGAPARRFASPFDLQQAANCLARGAQADARQALEVLTARRAAATLDANGDTVLADAAARAAEKQLEQALARFPHAVALAQGSIAMRSEDEGWAILASVHKKWATVDPDDRAEHLRQAVKAYVKLTGTKRGAYGLENRLQVTALRNRPAARKFATSLAGDSTTPSHGSGHDDDELVDAVSSQAVAFWNRVADGDLALTRLMLAANDSERASAQADLVDCYREAFRGRSTYAERSSTVDHLRDLSEVLPDDDARTRFLATALDELSPWSNSFAPATGDTLAVERTTPPAPVDGSGGRSPTAITLTAFHAACGDCLQVSYTGPDGSPHRLLVDGGLGTAFDKGLGAVLGPPNQPTSVDVAVVTHVDGDHIEGVLRAFNDGRLVAGDVWFNGREQLVKLFPDLGSRSTKQGDALSRLIPDEERNLAVGGAALVVGPVSPTVVPLPGGASVVLLSPTEDRLRRLLTKWPEPDTSRGSEQFGDELDVSALEKKLEDGEDTRGAGQFGGDSSVANGSSIGFIFEMGGVSILLTGDAYASVLTESIKALLTARQQDRLKVDVFKLPHHGSRQNMTDDLLGLIDPVRVLVCTDGSKFEHPDANAMEMVHRHYPRAETVFTDRTTVTEERFGLVGAVGPATSPVVLQLKR
jgi:hypothetical protein